MTANSDDYITFIVEKLQPIGEISTRRFFGGTGLTHGPAQFAMMMGNTLYFAVGEGSRERYRKLGCRCFSYMTSRGRVDVEKYYEAPASSLDDDEELVTLAREAINAMATSGARRRVRARK